MLVAEIHENVRHGCQTRATAAEQEAVDSKHPVTEIVSTFGEAGRESEEIEVQCDVFENPVELLSQEFIDGGFSSPTLMPNKGRAPVD